MADPLSALGLGMSAISLILQFTDECVKGYKYFTEAVHMPESYRYLRVQIHVEQQRFLSFAMEGGLLYDDGRISATLQVNQKVLRDVLAEMKSLFHQFEERSQKYLKSIGKDDVDWTDKGEPRTNLMELLSLAPMVPTNESAEDTQRSSLSRGIHKIGDRATVSARKLRTIFAEPRRFIWASVDKEEFQALIGRLEYLNSFLIGLLSTSQAKSLENLVQLNYLELLQLRDDVKSLDSLIRALDRYPAGHQEIGETSSLTPRENVFSETILKERQADADKRQYLRNLAKLKVRHIEIDQPQRPNTPRSFRISTATLLDYSAFEFSEDDVNSLDDGNQQKRRWVGNWEYRRVWVEWVEQACSQGPGVQSLQEDRVILLTRLLNESMSPEFRTPQCLGYIRFPREKEETKFGIVYGPPLKSEQDSLTTLRQALDHRPKPSINSRLALCSALVNCLFSFHSVDWLHKGLRSDNVLFFSKDVAQLNLNMPYITGYDLSRPSEAPEMTEEPPFNPWSDIYRHPAAQFGGARNFYRRSYDMYSLGIVLLEIALWKPIENILRIEDLRTIKTDKLRGIRKALLGLHDEGGETIDNVLTPGSSGYLTEVARKWGDSYRDIVEVCLRANDTEKPAYRGESRSSIRSRMRIMYKQQVIDRLDLMKEALGVLD
ncbi:prion-inhibition and propagation-domain-containing protein [Annulohypoxylon moriforme]|nr:prion-inhibition and propagation-domain-containing protein [Annulohypoxylon moriforme]